MRRWWLRVSWNALSVYSNLQTLWSIVTAWKGTGILGAVSAFLAAVVVSREGAPWGVIVLFAAAIFALVSGGAVGITHLWERLRAPRTVGQRVATKRNEDERLIFSLPWTATELTAMHHVERMSEIQDRFPVVSSDGTTTTQYKRSHLDAMSDTQRQKLFDLDPALKLWWQGLSGGSQKRFRLPGGYWIHRNVVERASQEVKRALLTDIRISFHGMSTDNSSRLQ